MSSTERAGHNRTLRSNRTPGFRFFVEHIEENRIDVTLWFLRAMAMFHTVRYFFPSLGSPVNAYYKALIANAATSALRLHQRQPRMSPSREFFIALLMEDSCHYLIYSLIFLYVSPFTLVLLPIFLFSMIHFSSYSLTLLDTIGRNSWWGCRLLISVVELQSRKILSLIALTEIILMPFSILLLFLSRAGLLTPFFYYQFLLMRYKSHRNPYTRNMFRELRIILDDIAGRPNTPAFLRSCINSIIQFVSRCAPPVPEAAAN